MMKKLQISLLLCLLIIANTTIQAQDYLITFAVLGEHETPDSVLVENQDQLTTLSLNGNDVLHLVETVGISKDAALNQPLKNFPNPIENSGTLAFYNAKKEKVHIGIYNSSGQLMTQKTGVLPQGDYSYKLEGLGEGTYIVRVSTKSAKRSVFLISHAITQSEPSIIYANSDYGPATVQQKSTGAYAQSTIQMQYNDGETLKFTAFLNSITSIEELILTSDQTIYFNLPDPVADFNGTPTEITEGESVSFTDQSTNNPTTWSWDFGDGNTGTEQNPSHVYNSEGTYTVSLTVENANGSNTETKMDYISVT
ncbi:MAG: PKD domain-containing protein, partial [Salinivirgaceae bacterium]|nr:PKD domain-containing protein [Salinivirgaceae bacterium]